jgi:Na(+)-translocating NADH:ubiquinone oxidoreductase A subunit
MMVNAGDHVKAGTPLFFDKYNPDVFFTSPVSGKILAVNRGERRKILEVVIRRAKRWFMRSLPSPIPMKLSREEIAGLLLQAGLWPLIKQRPYGIIPRPQEQCRGPFLSRGLTLPHLHLITPLSWKELKCRRIPGRDKCSRKADRGESAISMLVLINHRAACMPILPA